MKFGPVPTSQALGAVLAHAQRVEDGVLKKGLVLEALHIQALSLAGIQEVIVAQLEAQDVPENAAAAQIAEALLSEALEASEPIAGRVNLFSTGAGLLRVDAPAVHALNGVDEAITFATLADFTRLEPRMLAGTVKIIPFSAPCGAVEAAAALVRARPALKVAFPKLRTARLVLTQLPGVGEKLIDKGAQAVRARLAALDVKMAAQTTPHAAEPVAQALAAAQEDLLLVLTASATMDRQDVAPAAMRLAGGRVERFGMPVDPGNLLALGALNERPIVALPGCVRAPKLNGADWVLERLICGAPVGAQEVAQMGVGGLLKEIPSRPQPRLSAGPRKSVFVSAVLLAAGASRRMGAGKIKQLEDAGGVPVARRVAEALLSGGVNELIVVVGAQANIVKRAFDGMDVKFIEALDWDEGMAASMRAGVKAVSAQADAAMVALADMPEVSPGLIKKILAAYAPQKQQEIIRPQTPKGRAGHPVLFGRRFFETLLDLRGDVGAREVLREHADYVSALPVDEEAAAIDLDTPEQWRAWRARRENI